MSRAKTILMLSAIVMFVTVPAVAVPLDVYSIDGPQDPLLIEGPVHELGDWFPPDELIESSHVLTDETACWDGNDDEYTSNVLVTMTNLTNIDWRDVHYVADPETTITNFDGRTGNVGLNDDQYAFRIDNLGIDINRPLVFESLIVDNIFQAGEIWEFIIQDFSNQLGIPPTPFGSIGIASLSNAANDPAGTSSGSIIAIPEPATMCLLVLGGIGALLRRRK